jgi:nitrite reductase/ring-hydroxylating ferredoxin subunit
MTRTKQTVPRRQILELGAAGAALLVLPEACSSSTSAGGGDASVDGPPRDATVNDAPIGTTRPCKTDFVDAGGGCAESDQTAAVNILKAGLDKEGTSYEFSDCRYMDPACNDDRIIVIHLSKEAGYVALQGACPNECCDTTMENGGPTYFAFCTISIESSFPAGFVCNVDAGAPFDAGPPPDGGVDAEAPPDAGFDAGSDSGVDAGDASDANLVGEAGLQDGQTLKDILFCTCCGSVFAAPTGARITGPSRFGLQKLDTCEADGWVFITIPKVP